MCWPAGLWGIPPTSFLYNPSTLLIYRVGSLQSLFKSKLADNLAYKSDQFATIPSVVELVSYYS